MRTLIAAAVCLTLSSGAAGQDKEKKDTSDLPKKGDAVAVKGCFRGGAVEATDVGADGEGFTPLLGTTFRLTGRKDVLKEMKEKQEGRLVEVRGRLKSDLQQQAGYGTNLGRMRVTIGGPTGSPGARDAANQRALPVLEVSGFEGTGTPCGR
jgi:hypothetical protein